MIMTKELLDEIELISDAFCDEQLINKYRDDYIARLQEIVDLCCAEAVDEINSYFHHAECTMTTPDEVTLSNAITKRLKGDV